MNTIKYLLFASSLFIINIAHAEQFLVLHWSNESRIDLSKQSCLVPTLKGNRAAIQTFDGKFIRGCWNIDKHNSENVRIDWDNPKFPNDFAVLPMQEFQLIDK